VTPIDEPAPENLTFTDANRPAILPVGLAEIAERLGVARQTVDAWRTRGRLPAPRWTVGGRPAWAWCDIETWAVETGRLDP